MRSITTDQLLKFVDGPQPPCCSLFQPTHRAHPENQQDPIRFRNLVKTLEQSLTDHPRAETAAGIIEQLAALGRDNQFWNHRTEGLAILADGNQFEVFDLQRSVPEVSIVADSFHVKPLLRILQSADRFQVLCLTRHSVSLFEGNRDSLDPVDLTNVPTTITDALGEELSDPHRTVASYGGTRQAMNHGHGSQADERNKDRERFFRVIDEAILKHHSQPSGLPMILAALPEHHAPFREVTKNRFLIDGGIAKDPTSMDTDQLRREAWALLEPIYLKRLADWIDRFQAARVRHQGSDDLSDVARAAVEGRVESVLIEAGRKLPGRIDPQSGAIRSDQLDHPEVDDKLDDLAEIVLRTKGQVIVAPTARMPSDSGLAAIYRF